MDPLPGLDAGIDSGFNAPVSRRFGSSRHEFLLRFHDRLDRRSQLGPGYTQRAYARISVYSRIPAAHMAFASHSGSRRLIRFSGKGFGSANIAKLLRLA